jgi:hypothetical protein
MRSALVTLLLGFVFLSGHSWAQESIWQPIVKSDLPRDALGGVFGKAPDSGDQINLICREHADPSIEIHPHRPISLRSTAKPTTEVKLTFGNAKQRRPKPNSIMKEFELRDGVLVLRSKKSVADFIRFGLPATSLAIAAKDTDNRVVPIPSFSMWGFSTALEFGWLKGCPR